MTERDKAEKRALELFPDLSTDQTYLLNNVDQVVKRQAYMKCWEDMEEEVKDESEDWKMVMECAQTIVNIVKEK